MNNSTRTETTKPTGPLTYVAPSGNNVFLGSYIKSAIASLLSALKRIAASAT